MPATRRAGATLVDLAVTLAVLCVLAMVAVPRLSATLDRLRVDAGTRRVAAAYALAREGAIFRARFVALDLDAGAGTVTVASGTDTLAHLPLGADLGVTLRTTQARTVFAPTGLGWGVGNATVVIARGGAADTVIVSRLGRVRH